MEIIADRGALLEQLLRGYETYFDITHEPEHPAEIPLTAFCSFNAHSEKYVLIKKAKLWETDSYEYVYVFSVPELDAGLFQKCQDYAYEEGMKWIHPAPGHMYSYITAVFLCGTCTADAEKKLRRSNISKSFHFSWYGWMNLHTAAIVCEGGRVFTNRLGRCNTKFMKNTLHSCVRQKGGISS